MCVLLTDNDLDRNVVVVFRCVIAEMNPLKNRRCHHHYRNKSGNRREKEKNKKIMIYFFSFNFLARSVAVAFYWIWCQLIQGLKYKFFFSLA